MAVAKMGSFPRGCSGCVDLFKRYYVGNYFHKELN